MIDSSDFKNKQVIVFIPKDGDKISYRNDNIIITDVNSKIKFQCSCYRLFCIFVIGNVSLTSGIIMRAHKFKYAICLFNTNMKLYQIINGKMEGNTYLRTKQYRYNGLEIGQAIIKNKIENQRDNLKKIRKKVPATKDAIKKLNGYCEYLNSHQIENLQSLLGIEGVASRVYFSQIFLQNNWKGRKPRVKNDYINSILDIGYTILFNMVDAILQLFGFDVYYGVLHTCFYMRKSLVCDLMEPFRPLIDWKVRTGIALGQFKEDDFECINNQWRLKYKKNAEYVMPIMQVLIDNKDIIFTYIRDYYRCIMKNQEHERIPVVYTEEVTYDID